MRDSNPREKWTKDINGQFTEEKNTNVQLTNENGNSVASKEMQTKAISKVKL